jgi:hypothetical protein
VPILFLFICQFLSDLDLEVGSLGTTDSVHATLYGGDRHSYLDQGGTTPLLRAYAIDCPRCSC